LRPHRGAGGREFRDVARRRRARIDQRAATEIARAVEITTEQDVARPVDVDPDAIVVAGVAEALRPEVPTVRRRVLRQEDVVAARARERAAPEVRGVLEYARDDDVPERVDGHGARRVDAATPRAAAPERPAVGTTGREEIAVPLPGARDGSPPEVGGADERAGGEERPGPVHGDAGDGAAASRVQQLRPEMR